MPLLVRQLLRVLEENPKSKVINEGLPYALGIFFCLVLNAFANHRHRHLAMKTGIILRSCLVGVIYERVLRLQPRGRQGLTSGEVTTLVAIDTQKVRRDKSVRSQLAETPTKSDDSRIAASHL